MRFAAGTEFAGYVLEARLGRGGMATVYLVREPGIDRLVALKVLPEQLSDDAHFATRFEQEARVIGGLDHPNIIPLYRYGITDEIPWMALRYVDGGDFGRRLAERPLAVQEGLEILKGIAAAIDYAHRRGVIHRDLKPQNILLSREGAVYLADFGVAKMIEGSSLFQSATGSIVGTPAYMAPEQAQGHPLGSYTDVYALAVVCFQWLTGDLPFDADTPHAILMKHVRDPVPAEALRMLSSPVADVLLRGLAKKPEQRIQTAGALIAELETALCAAPAGSTGIVAGPMVPPSPPAPVDSQPSPMLPEPRPRHQATSRETQLPDATAGSLRFWKPGLVVTMVLLAAIGAYIDWGPNSGSAPAAAVPNADLPSPSPTVPSSPKVPSSPVQETASTSASSWLDSLAGQPPAHDLSHARFKMVILSDDMQRTIDDPNSLTSQDFASVSRGTDPNGGAQLEFSLTTAGAQKMGTLSAAHIGQRMAFVVGGVVERTHAAVIRSVIFDRMTMNFTTAAEADDFISYLLDDHPSPSATSVPNPASAGPSGAPRDVPANVLGRTEPSRTGPDLSSAAVSPPVKEASHKPTPASAGPKLLHRVEPVYPEIAQRLGRTGYVLVAFTVDEDGGVGGASVVKGDPPGVFDSAALAAIGKWRYSAGGKRVAKQIRFTFKLAD